MGNNDDYSEIRKSRKERFIKNAKNYGRYGFTREEYDVCFDQINEWNMMVGKVMAIILTISSLFSAIALYSSHGANVGRIPIFMLAVFEGAIIVFIISIFAKEFYSRHIKVFLYIIAILALAFTILFGRSSQSGDVLQYVYLCLLLSAIIIANAHRIAILIFVFDFVFMADMVYIVPEDVFRNNVMSISVFTVLAITLHFVLQHRRVQAMLGSYNFQQAQKELLKKNTELVDAYKEANAANRAKSDFLANMSHEIRTPINAVLGMNEMILRESDDDNVIVHARAVESAGQTLLSIINDILDFSKIESGKMEISYAKYKFSSVLYDVSNMTRIKAGEKGLDFQIDVDSYLPDVLLGDEIRVRQVMVNILSNAIKYTREGSVTLAVRGDQVGDVLNLVIKVIDTGIGIKKEDLIKIFGKFERADLIRNKTIEGTGLGLAITRNLVSLMKGDINVKSEYGQGSTFTIEIPQKVVGEERIGDFNEKFERESRENTKYRVSFTAPEANVLAVDDTDTNIIVLQELLKQTGVNIDAAYSGVEALGYTAKKKYDLILMDQMMPEMDGTQTLAAIREQLNGRNLETPVICLTADAVIGAKEKYLRQGFSGYLTKPVVGKNLEELLMRYIPEEKVEIVEIPMDEEETKAPSDNEIIRNIYSECETLSYDEAMLHNSGDEMLYNVLKSFFDSVPKNATIIEDSLNEGDYKEYRIKVHALKSSARMIGDVNLSQNAWFLEECADIADKAFAVDMIKERTPALLEAYRAYIEVLAPYLADDEDDDLPLMDDDMLEETYSAIKELAAAFDGASLEFLLDEIGAYRVPDAEKERFKRLKECILSGDWNGINEILG